MEEWTNQTNITDLNVTNKEDLYETFLDGSRFWIQKVLLPLVVIIGIIGNGITVVVLTRRRMRSSTNTYLTALAISDLLYLIFVFTLSLEHYPNSHGSDFYHYWAYYRFGIWFVDATTSVSTWLTVAFTVERYIAICHPMTGKSLCTESRARIVILVVYILGFLATVSTPFEWQVYEKNITENGNDTEIYVGIKETDLALNDSYTTAFSWFWSITFVFIPLLLLGIFNSFLIFAVHDSRKKRCKMTQTDHASSTQRQENKITITLIAVVILFMICQIPTAIMFILKNAYKPFDYPYLDKPYRILGNIFNFLVTINAAANFLLYCAFSARYRRTLVATFFGKCIRLSSPAHSTVTTPDSNHLKRGASRGSTMRERSHLDNRSTTRSFYIAEPKNGIVNRQSSLYVPKARSTSDLYK